MAYSGLGLDLISILGSLGQTALTGAQNAVLSAGGKLIATTPQGQTAIQQSLLDQAKAKTADALAAAKPYLVPAGIVLALVFLNSRGRRR